MLIMATTKPTYIAIVGFGPGYIGAALVEENLARGNPYTLKEVIANANSLVTKLQISGAFAGIVLGLIMGRLIDLPKSSPYKMKLSNLILMQYILTTIWFLLLSYSISST